MIVEILIDGTPAPQGSKTPWGSEANANTKPWRGTVAAAGAHVMGERGLLAGALSLEVAFVFPRPKSHYGTGKRSTLLKPSAPTFMPSPPDVDKLVRAIADALQGVVYRNDSQLAVVYARKFYGPRAYCQLVVSELPQVLPVDAPSRRERLLKACDGDTKQARNVEKAVGGKA
ncbi:MAG TPA: RusA family crossover junction endodeoxyribonuclease [Candidatus Binatus sp.]|nr:RusA family crossover junction endodeoxyribonuclease [Candidatus Binatus sp.]